jgi:hypothetical protein
LLTLLAWPVTAVTAAAQTHRPERRSVENETTLSADDRRIVSLAESRFVVGDVTGALDALNRIDLPRVSSVKVEGLVRAKRRVVTDYLGLQPGELFTAGKLAQTARRLEELPVASSGTVRFDPLGRVATVTPIVSERAPFPGAPVDWVPVGARAAFLKEARVDISDVAGWGEGWQPAYRWDRNRPRAMLRLAVPAPGALPGLLRVETFWDRQTYGNAAVSAALFRQSRFRAAAALSDWVAGWLRLEGGLALDRVDGDNYVGLDAGLNARALENRVAVIVKGGRWFSAGDGLPFSSGELVVTARSTTRTDAPALTALAGLARSSQQAPPALWSGASAGQGRGVLLRAHQLLTDGIVDGEVFGRQLFFATAEYVHPVPTRGGPVGIAVFVDAAHARSRLDPATSSSFHVDVGGGVRVNTSRSGNAVRLDFGSGLRDGRKRVSAGYVIPWGER